MAGEPRSPEAPHIGRPDPRDLHPRDPSTAELGQRIRMLRVARGLTLKEIEARGGVSATHVSEIERGRASPTVGALGRIARALGLRPAALVEPHVRPEVSVTRAGERRSGHVRIGAAIIEPLTEPAHGALVGAQIVTLPAGCAEAFTHRHEGEEWVMVMTGAAEIRVDGESHPLRESDAVHFRAHREHTYSNLTSNPAVLLVVTRPRVSL
jgi:transcriptional regulator with XRE-family HTH domain